MVVMAKSRTDRRRGFQPPWYNVSLYECPVCKAETCVRNRGSGPQVPGAFRCSCGRVIGFNGRCDIGRKIE